MTHNQNAEFSYLFNSLDSYRIKYLKLLNEGSSNEELTYCQKAIQFYLSAMEILKRNAQKRNQHFTFSLKSVSRWLTGLIKPKPKYAGYL